MSDASGAGDEKGLSKQSGAWVRAWLSRVLAVGISVFLLGCGSGPEQGSEGSADPSPEGSILIWHRVDDDYISPDQQARFEQELLLSADRFKALHPRFRLLQQAVPAQAFSSRLTSEIRKGLGPDLVILSAEALPDLVDRDVLDAIPKGLVPYGRFREAALRQIRHENQLWALPLNVHVQALCYDRRKLNELPGTLTELQTLAAKGFSLGFPATLFDSFWGVGLFSEKPIRLNDERMDGATIRAWQDWMGWQREAVKLPNIVFSPEVRQLEDAFLRQELPMMVCGSYQVARILSRWSEADLGLKGLSLRQGQQASPLLEVVAVGLVKRSSARQRLAAEQFLAFMTNQQQQTLASTSQP